ncbi:hypothetical protein FOCC_FOCC011654, partial [Frankliniella occidentalis]
MCALAERVAVALAVPTIAQCVPPLFAAPQRTSLVFSCILFGRICLLAAPFVGNLVVYGEALPLTAFGLQLVLAGLCALALALLHASEDRAARKDPDSTFVSAFKANGVNFAFRLTPREISNRSVKCVHFVQTVIFQQFYYACIQSIRTKKIAMQFLVLILIRVGKGRRHIIY